MLQITLEQGLILSLMSMGVWISYRILNIADLSVEGSFPLGAFLLAKALTLGAHPLFALLIAFLGGCMAGLMTSLWITKLKVTPLLAGIMTLTTLYTVNLRVHNSPNINLYSMENALLFQSIVPIVLLVFAVKFLLDYLLRTEWGYLLRATGSNPVFVESLGQSVNHLTTLGLSLANGLVATSGAVLSSYQGFVDISMGQAMIVTALASILIGEPIARRVEKISMTLRVLIGTVLYRLIGSVVLMFGLEATDLKLISVLILAGFIGYNQKSAQWKPRKTKEVSSHALYTQSVKDL